MGKYKSYGTLSKTTHFLSVFCEAGVVQLCTEAQAEEIQDGLKAVTSPLSCESWPLSQCLVSQMRYKCHRHSCLKEPPAAVERCPEKIIVEMLPILGNGYVSWGDQCSELSSGKGT